MNNNLNTLLNRLETTKTMSARCQLRFEDKDGYVYMCPLGHLVDIWIALTPGAFWLADNHGSFFNPNENEVFHFPSDDVLAAFGLSYADAKKIYRCNDTYGMRPSEVAQFIRQELVADLQEAV